MMSAPDADEIRRELSSLGEEGLEVVLYGSGLTDRFTPRSDLDVAVLSRSDDATHNRSLWLRLLGCTPDRYDLHVFELLPLPIQIDIADHHRVLFGDAVEVSYYFYAFRRRWRDQSARILGNRFESVAEKRDALARARRGSA